MHPGHDTHEHIYSKQINLVNTWQKQQLPHDTSLARLPVPGFTAKLKRHAAKMQTNTGNDIEGKVGNRRAWYGVGRDGHLGGRVFTWVTTY